MVSDFFMRFILLLHLPFQKLDIRFQKLDILLQKLDK